MPCIGTFAVGIRNCVSCLPASAVNRQAAIAQAKIAGAVIKNL